MAMVAARWRITAASARPRVKLRQTDAVAGSLVGSMGACIPASCAVYISFASTPWSLPPLKHLKQLVAIITPQKGSRRELVWSPTPKYTKNVHTQLQQ